MRENEVPATKKAIQELTLNSVPWYFFPPNVTKPLYNKGQFTQNWLPEICLALKVT